MRSLPYHHRSMPAARRFPRPLTIEEHAESFIVPDRNWAGARLLSTSGMMSSSEARTGVHRFRALDGWQVADGVTGFGRTTLALSVAMSATSSWSLGLSETATLCWDVACLPSVCVDLNVSS